jgi:DegV family protein with EDD domain
MPKQKVAVIVDSTANLPTNLIQEYDLSVIPLNVIWGGESYYDGIDITTAEFYDRLAKSSDSPTTSQPSIGDFHDLYTKLAETAEGIVCATISSELSGTYASATGAADMMEGFPIEVIDTRTASMAHGFVALAAARAAAAGADYKEAAAAARSIVDRLELYFAVDTLEYLHRGGRIGGAQRLIGSVLSIKPVLQIEDGRIEALASVRTKRKALQYLVDLAEKNLAGKSDLHLAVLHSVSPDEARWLGDALQEKLNPVELIYGELSPVIGTHTGPGTVGFGGYSGS